MRGGAEPQPEQRQPLVILVQYAKDRAACDHFAGVAECLHTGATGMHARCLHVSEHDADRIAKELARLREEGPRTDAHAFPAVVAVKDTQSPLALYALRQARRHGAATALLMDGIVEYRNTFVNPWVEEGFLRPAPVDLVMAAGPCDAERLMSWGNRVVSTGLPRLDALGVPRPDAMLVRAESVRHAARDSTTRGRPVRVLVATAKRAAFNDAEFEQLLEALRVVKSALESRVAREGIMWRLTEGLDVLLGVENVPPRRTLLDCLHDASAVLTTPSTLMIESMLAGCPTGLLQPFAGELWQKAAWVWTPKRPVDLPHEEHALDAMMASMLTPTAMDAHRQHECLTRLIECGKSVAGGPSLSSERVADHAALRVAQALTRVATAPRDASKPPHEIARLPASRVHGDSCSPPPSPRSIHTPSTLVINMVSVDHSPVGGVMSWAFRLSRELPRQRPQIEVRTLAVVASPEALSMRGFELNPDGTTDVCVLDPMTDAHDRVEHLCQALERVCLGCFGEEVGAHPPRVVILPNFNDVCYMSALLTRARLNKRWGPRDRSGVRVVAVAHTDTEYYKSLLAHYHTYDGAVGVSAACAAWLTRPVASSDVAEPPARSSLASPPALAAATNVVLRAVPVREIPCGVEVDDAPQPELASESPHGPLSLGRPLRLGYIGRIVEEQKRVSALLRLAQELDAQDFGDVARGFELHVVGDGPDMARFVRDAAATSSGLRHGRIVNHGRKSLSWVESFTRTLDVSVLVSTYEGTSVTMLEAMARGVVPCVTDVGSGVREWLRDGDNAIVVPVDRVEDMAPRLAELARDPARRARLGRAAWETVRGNEGRETSANIVSTARSYASLIDELFARPAVDLKVERRLDCALVPMDTWRWPKTWCDDPHAARTWCEQSLHDLGYTRTHIFDMAAGEPATADHVQRARSGAKFSADTTEAVGIAFVPLLADDGLVGRVLELLRAELGARKLASEADRKPLTAAEPARIAVFGTGHHTRRLRVLFERSAELLGVDPFVGFLDDAVATRGGAGGRPPNITCFNRPVVNPDDAVSFLRANVVLLSSDAFEAKLWARTADLRARGVRVIALYGPHEPARTKPAHALKQEALPT